MKVLIIDDNKDITRGVCFYLERIGISCKAINQGKEGLETIKKEHFDLIILDFAIPEFSGYDIFEALKSEDLLKSKNILVFTASSPTDKDIENILASGAKEILKKPLSIQELEETINRFR
jgi:DNA-binding response OmpR family regulator